MNLKTAKLESIQISIPENIESEKMLLSKIPKSHNIYRGQLQKARASLAVLSKDSSRSKDRNDFDKQARAIDSILQNNNALSQLYQKVMLSSLANQKLETDYAEFANQYLREDKSQGDLEQLIKRLGGKKVKQQFSPPDAISGANSNVNPEAVFNEHLNILELVIF